MLMEWRRVESAELGKLLGEHQGWLTGKANHRRATLKFADLSDRTLEGVNLAGADLTGCRFHRTRLAKINLEGAMLYGADLLMANLEFANLAKADMQGISLRAANLSPGLLTRRF